MARIGILYHSDDTVFAGRLRDDLNQRGLDSMLIDRALYMDQPFEPPPGLQIVVFLLSESATHSERMEAIWRSYHDRGGLLVARYRPAINETPFEHTAQVDFYQTDYDISLQQLIDSLAQFAFAPPSPADEFFDNRPGEGFAGSEAEDSTALGLDDEVSLEDTGAFQPAPAPPAQMPAPAAPPPPAPEPKPARQREEAKQKQETIPASQPAGASRSLSQPAAQTVQFSAYYPREVRPEDWQPLQAYIYKPSAEEQTLADAEKTLGPLAGFRRMVESALRGVSEGMMVTAVPRLPGFQFNPPSLTIGFYEDWHRFDFKMRAHDAPLNQAANGALSFSVEGILVADIPLSVFVSPQPVSAPPQASAPQPLYDTVFASYSHQDSRIVERVEAAAKTLGMSYLRDVITLRSGEHWNKALLEMIDQANIFQLFWSPASAQSAYCQQEWEYALNLKRDDQLFIRPVYWTQPMPDPPATLEHLHFAYQPELLA